MSEKKFGEPNFVENSNATSKVEGEASVEEFKNDLADILERKDFSPEEQHDFLEVLSKTNFDIYFDNLEYPSNSTSYRDGFRLVYDRNNENGKGVLLREGNSWKAGRRENYSQKDDPARVFELRINEFGCDVANVLYALSKNIN